MTTVGFIGTGVMGKSMAGHILDAGFDVIVYNRTKKKADSLVERGAIWADSPALVTEKSDVILSIVGFPKDVETIYFGEQGVFSVDVTGKYLIDLTTSTPTLAQKIAQTATDRGAHGMDAPVSGGDLGAQAGRLTVMVGGSSEDLKAVEPVLEPFSSAITLQGGPGAGQHTKMANQIMIAGTMTGMVELLVYAKKAGLDLEKVLKTVGGGAAANWSLSHYAPQILKDDYSPGFFAKHFLKDLTIALDEAKKMGLELPATQVARDLYGQLVDEGYGMDGTQALIKLWWQ